MALFDYLLKTYCIPLSLWFVLVVVTVYTGLVPCCVPWCTDLHCPASLCVPLSCLSLHPYAKLTFASIQLCLSVLFSVVLCLLFCLLHQPDNVYSNNIFIPFTFYIKADFFVWVIPVSWVLHLGPPSHMVKSMLAIFHLLFFFFLFFYKCLD